MQTFVGATNRYLAQNELMTLESIQTLLTPKEPPIEDPTFEDKSIAKSIFRPIKLSNSIGCEPEALDYKIANQVRYTPCITHIEH
jgi:hypothetical protein